jgi:hypothetical protein
MKRSVFLSYSRPINAAQQAFVGAVTERLAARGFEARTLGVTDYDMDAPLKAIRRLLLECNGVLTLAFRRLHVGSGTSRPGDADEQPLVDAWLSSPYAQVEPVMAFQLGLPVLIARERGVFAEGVLERGVLGTGAPDFDLSLPAASYLDSPEWLQGLQRWEGYVSRVIERKGEPPERY